jgi:hypothetical protein
MSDATDDVSETRFWMATPTGNASESLSGSLGGQMPKRDQETDSAAKREALELVRAHYCISGVGVRQRLTHMIRAIAAASSLPGSLDCPPAQSNC